MITNPIILAAFEQDITRLMLMFHIQWPSGDVYTHTRSSQKYWDGRIWYGVSDYASISGMQSGSKAQRLELCLQVPSPQFVSEANEDGIIGSQVKMYIAALDDKRRVSASELVAFKLISDINITHDPVTLIKLMCGGHRERFRSAKEYLRLSKNAWRARHPNDSYCDDVAAIAKGPLNSYSGSEKLGTVVSDVAGVFFGGNRR